MEIDERQPVALIGDDHDLLTAIKLITQWVLYDPENVDKRKDMALSLLITTIQYHRNRHDLR